MSAPGLYSHFQTSYLLSLCLSFHQRNSTPLLQLPHSLRSLKTRVKMSPSPESLLSYPLLCTSTGLATIRVLLWSPRSVPISPTWFRALWGQGWNCFAECVHIVCMKNTFKKEAKSPIIPALFKFLVDLQCCVNFCCIAKWSSHTYIHILFYILFHMVCHRILNIVLCAIQ